MKHAELLHDPASLERGEELIELYIDSFKRFRRSLHVPEDHLFELDSFPSIVHHMIGEATKTSLDDKGYAKLGKGLVSIMEAQEDRRRLFTEAYQPVVDFLGALTDSPIAVDTRDKSDWDYPVHDKKIKAYRSQEMRKVGGFLSSILPAEAILGINQKAGAEKPRYKVQVFDGSFGRLVKPTRIAIAT